jgi:hypothetical protein
MADRNAVGTDSDFFDQQAYDFLPLRDLEGLGAGAQSSPELGEGLTQPQITGLVDGGRLDCLPLGGDGVPLPTECWHPGAQFFECHQLLLVGRNQPIQGVRDADLLTPELVNSLSPGIGLPRRFAPSREFGFDECRILEEPQHLAPHERIEMVFSNRGRIADGAVRVLIPLAPPAAVHAPPPIHRISTLRADQQSL